MPYLGSAAICYRARGRLFFSAKFTRLTLLCRNSKPIGPKGELQNRYFLHDTRVRAEGNGGHLYGTQLSDDDKNKLLEYLKTL